MVANGSHIGSAQLSGPDSSSEAGDGGFSVLSLLGDPDTALALMFAVAGTLATLYLAMPH